MTGVDATRAPRHRGGIGVRARAALAATLIVALALAVGSAALVIALQQSLTAGIETSIEDRAEEVGAVLEALPAGSNAAEPPRTLRDAVEAASRQSTAVQILDAGGRVVAESDDLDGDGPLLDVAGDAGESEWRDTVLPDEDDERYRLLREEVETPSGTFTVLVAQSLEPVQESTEAVLPLLAVGLPLLLLVVAASTFWLVGRSLRPVEAIRAKVAAIGGRELQERVPVPAARDEIARLATTMNGMLARLEASQRSQRRFVADASHELRSPIATIKAMGETAVAHPDRALDAATAEGFVDEATRMERLVNALLLLARADELGLAQEREDVDLDDLLRAERDRIRSTTSLRVDASIQPVRVSGSPLQLGQAVRNLVDNAVRHARTEVVLSVRADGGRAVLEVRDDGTGIPAADRERVFERFVRLDESRARDEGGTGLGLAIVREVVLAHGGTVEVVESETGAAFRVSLPAQRVEHG
ncbi:sensor histidine kinase [Agrococcus sp. Ld7]|uniref:sensor histidine kinase n=1 Tax=Agrococcus sp. Ld7 TaxID=649148 RepID=UPI0038679245